METPHTPEPRRRTPGLTRRGVIGAAGAVAAGAALTPVAFGAEDGASPAASAPDGAASAPAASGVTAAKQFPRTRSTAATGTGQVSTSFPITYVGMAWTGSAAQGARIRLTGQDGAPGEWRSVNGACCARRNGGGAALVAADSAVGYQIDAPAGAGEVRSVAIDTTSGERVAVPVPADTTRMRGVEYLSRAAWGADESKRYKGGKVNSPEKYHSAQAVTVHHTDTRNDDPDPAATVRAIYQHHAVTLDWGDIGYHFLIDEAGTIYEGRYSGDDGLPAHDTDGYVVTGFHTLGHNSGNLGIALLGNLSAQDPTDAARESLISLVAMLTRFHGMDPQATVTYRNPISGATKEVITVSGHRDWLATDCPGGVMYGLLDEVRAAASWGG